MRENIENNNNQQTTNNNILFNMLDTEKQLLKSTTTTPLIREINKKNGIKLMLNKNIRYGYSDNEEKTITIGEQNIPEDFIKQLGFKKDSDNDSVKSYIFSHENNHHVLWYMSKNQDKFPMFAGLYNTLKSMRLGGELGLSQLGSYKEDGKLFYYNRKDKDGNIINTSHDEDLVELLNKYCIKPKVLQDHLQYLVGGDKEELKNKGLLKISQPIADYFFNNVVDCITRFLKENGVKITST